MPNVSKLKVRVFLNQMGLTSTDVPDQAIDQAMGEVDQDAIMAEEDTALVWERWDKQSPINGVPAAVILANRAHDIPVNGEVYLLRDTRTGGIVTFQPHAPGAGGLLAMTSDTLPTYAEKHRSDKASENAEERILTAILSKLGL